MSCSTWALIESHTSVFELPQGQRTWISVARKPPMTGMVDNPSLMPSSMASFTSWETGDRDLSWSELDHGWPSHMWDSASPACGEDPTPLWLLSEEQADGDSGWAGATESAGHGWCGAVFRIACTPRLNAGGSSGKRGRK